MNCLAIISIFGTILVYGVNQLYERVMQDFTKPLAASNAAPTAKTKWLTKDRFWNFVFWFAMSFGFAVTFSVSSEQQAKYNLGTIFIWATMIGVPLLVRHFSKTTCVKDNIFLNSEGDLITEEQTPKSTFLALLAGVGLTFIIAETILPKGYNNFFLDIVFFLSVFSGISLYFIYKNCPISILFNRKAWELRSTERRKSSGNDDYYERHRRNSNNSHARTYDSSYRHLPGNIHHR